MFFTATFNTPTAQTANVAYIEIISCTHDVAAACGDGVVPAEFSAAMEDFANGRVVDLDTALNDDQTDGQ